MHQPPFIPSLVSVTRNDYTDIKHLQEWLTITEPLPTYFIAPLVSLPFSMSVEELLTEIRRELDSLYNEQHVKARSLAESRFTGVTEALERKLASCGVWANVFGTALRQLSIPVQYIHGRIEGQHGDNRHAWLKLYNPNDKSWVEVDPGNPRFAMEPGAKEIKTYHNWDELKQDYDQGKY